MAPGSSSKRKRPDRPFSQDDGSGRPSPHRPESLGLAQQRNESVGGRGGARGGRDSRRSSRQGGLLSEVGSANATPVTPRNGNTPAAPNLQPPGTPLTAMSRAATPVPSAGTPAPQNVEESQTAAPAPYAYDHLTDDILASWDESGRQSVLSSAEEADEVTLSILLQELVRACLDGRLEPSVAGSAVKELLSQQHEGDVDAEVLFRDTIALLDDADIKNTHLLPLLTAAEIDPELLRQEMEATQLPLLSLARPSFYQMRARKITNMLYRQCNYNLLREESEGYAKLLTEYFNIAQEAGSSKDIRPNVAEDAFQRIKALIGAFDLDVGRVLDITLDISANALVRAHAFFIKFYRCSSWWPDNGSHSGVKWEDQGFTALPDWALPSSGRHEPEAKDARRLEILQEERDAKFWDEVRDKGTEAFFALGARRIVDYDSVAEMLETELQPPVDQSKELDFDKRKRINENRKYMRETRTLPPMGNADAAQLLGFKLRFYASARRETGDVLPQNLMALAALLIKIGFISLRDLYPHLHPAEDLMAEEKTRLEAEKAEKEAKERPGGGPNALATASALTDDTLPATRGLRGEKGSSGAATPKGDAKPAGAAETAAPPENQKIALLKFLLLIGALPEALFILGRFPWLVDADVSLPPFLHRIVRRMLSKMSDDLRPLSDRPSMDTSRDQVSDTAEGPDATMTFTTRPARRPITWLGLDTFETKDGVEYRHYYKEWTDNIPVCRNVEDVFQLCNTFIGYLGVKIGQDPEILSTLVRVAKKSLLGDTSEANRTRWLDLMKRLLVPALSMSKHNPGLADEVWGLLKLFPITTRYNIYAEWFVGRTSRLPDMRTSFEHNRAEVREVLRRVSNDNAKKQSRALGKVSFASPGVVMAFIVSQVEIYSNMIPALVECTRFFSDMSHDVLIWCLINSLSGQGRDRMQADGMLTSSWLQALSQFVASLFFRYSTVNPAPVLQYLASELRAGNSTDLEMFEQVLTEMAGIRPDVEFNDSQVLAMAGGEHLQSHVLQQLGDTRHARKSTAKRLIKALAEPRLIGQTLIAIAQERQMYAHHEGSQLMPLKVLGNNLDKIQQVFAQYLEVLRTNMTAIDFEAAVPDVVRLVAEFGLEPGVAFTICRYAIAYRMAEADEAGKAAEAEAKKAKAISNGDVEMQDTAASTADNKLEASSQAEEKVSQSVDGPPTTHWHPVLQPIIDRLKTASPDLAGRISIEYYVTFWTLAQTDVVVIMEAYTNELARLDRQIAQIHLDNRDKSTLAVREREKQKKALQTVQDGLRLEVKDRVAIYRQLTQRLSREEKSFWFDTSRTYDDSELDSRHINLLQECFLPRAMMSAVDAHYSYLMLKMLHDKGTPGFSTLRFFNQLFQKNLLAAVFFQCTAIEAQHLGRFLNEVLKLLATWHASKDLYEKEAIGKLPGFVTKTDATGAPESHMDFEAFRQELFKWHTKLSAALKSCFESGEYMHIRNGVMVLKAIVQVFPALNFMGKNMQNCCTAISEKDERSDLKLMALSLMGPLKNRESKWISPQLFRLNETKKEEKEASRSASAVPEVPKLNASAVEFKPTPAVVANSKAEKEPMSAVEDGEVRDEKLVVVAKPAAAEVKEVPFSKPAAVDIKEAPTPRKVTQPASVVIREEFDVAEIKPEVKPQPTVSAKEKQPLSSNPPTPAPGTPRAQPPVNGQSSHAPSRAQSVQSSAQSGYNLPSRPEPRAPPNKPTPPQNLPSRPESRAPSHVDERSGRLDRPTSRDHSPRGRSGRETSPPRSSRPPPHEERHRHPRDDRWTDQRREGPNSTPVQSRPQLDDRSRSNGPTGPPSSQGPFPHPDRVAHLGSAVTTSQGASPLRPNLSETRAPSTDAFTNPARLALIQGDNGAKPNSSREIQPTEPDRRSDRNNRDSRAPPEISTRNEQRSNGRQPLEPQRPPMRQEQSSDLTPSGPRDHGRLNGGMQPPRAHQESSYGRLNGPQHQQQSPPQDLAPSGPRSANGPAGRGGRNFTAPPQSAVSRFNEPAVPTPASSKPPDSSAGFRGPPRMETERHAAVPGQHQRQTSTSVPSTPAAESGPPIHPSRMPFLGNQQPAPIQTNIQPPNGPNSAHGMASPVSAPPTGPRSAHTRPPVNAPTGPSPVTSAPPSGPALNVDKRGRGDRGTISSINSITSAPHTGNGSRPTPRSSGPEVMGIRGAASRQNSVAMGSPMSAGPQVPSLVSPMEPPGQRGGIRMDAQSQSRQDGAGSRPESRNDHRSNDSPHHHNHGPDDGRGDGRNSRYGQGGQQQQYSDRNTSYSGNRQASEQQRKPNDNEPPQRQLPPPPPPPTPSAPQGQGGRDDGIRNTHGPTRDERRHRDERDSRSGPPPHVSNDYGNNNNSGGNMGPRSGERRPPLPPQSEIQGGGGNPFGNGPSQSGFGHNNNNNSRNGPDGRNEQQHARNGPSQDDVRRSGRVGGGGEDFSRGPRREDERRLGPPPQGPDGRKRMREEGGGRGFEENAKRRRSGM